jgi:hypothetical protein
MCFSYNVSLIKKGTTYSFQELGRTVGNSQSTTAEINKKDEQLALATLHTKRATGAYHSNTLEQLGEHD